MDVALAMQQYLNSHGIKQTFIAEKCGWSKQKTNTIVRGKKKITAEELAAICEAIEVPYDYFYQVVAKNTLPSA